jgi:flagellar hook-associated protein 1 FlgK
VAGLAGRIRLNSAVDPRAGGDPSLFRDGLGATVPGPAANGTLPRAMLDALTAPTAISVVPGLTAALSLARAVGGFAEITAIGRVSAEADVTGYSSSRSTLAAAEGDQIGVDSDTEMQALIAIEQAYAANVQVIQAASRMLDQLLEV